MKISNTIKTEFFPKYDLLKYLLLTSFTVFILSFFNHSLPYFSSTKIISSIVIIFGIIFSIVMTIIFYRLNSLIDKKQWFEVVQETKTFKIIRQTFVLTIVFNLTCIFTGLINNLFLSAFVLIYTILWTILSIKVLRILITQ